MVDGDALCCVVYVRYISILCAMGVLYHDPSRSLNGKRKKFASTKDRLIDNSHTSAYMQQLLILYTVKGVKRHQGRKKKFPFVCAAAAVARCDTVRRRRQCRHLSSFIDAKTTLASTTGGWLVQSLHFFFKYF